MSCTAFSSSGDGCEGCNRTAVLKEIIGLERDSFMTRLSERAISPCFHLQNFGGGPKWKPPEYYFTASYEAELNGRNKSRLDISLYFEDGELIHQWVTESDNPNFTFHAHLQKMFINPSALFRKWVPLDITLLNDFEKRPYKCNINPDKEELSPGQETKVKISNIADFEGRKSREFNRIVIQAVKGEIIGGTPLLSDPDLKAFQVGKEGITLTYKAPDEENSQATEDKIIIYNSCDILKKDEYPMPKTGLKDKIADKKIKLIHADAVMTITQKLVQNLDGAKVTWKATENAVLKYTDTLSDEDEGTFTENYDVKSWKLSNVKATIIDYENGWKQETQQAEKDDYGTDSLSITFNSKTGKATEVWIPHLAFWFLFRGTKRLPGETFAFFTDVKGGDGMHEMEGGGTQVMGSVAYEEKWNIKRYRNK